MFGLKGVFENEALVKGLVIQDNKESVDDKAIVECDGFIQYEAVLKKDFSCVLTSGEVDNIDYIPPTEMPICPAGSEINYDDPDYPWTAPDPSEEVTENSDDYITSSKLRWATGSITSMNPGETKYLSVSGAYGPVMWNINTSNITTGSIEHSLTSGLSYGTKAKYKTSDDCAGSFYVEARDAFKTINRTITIGLDEWFVQGDTGYYYKLRDLYLGYNIPYSFSQLSLKSLLRTPKDILVTNYQVSTDSGRPIETTTYTEDVYFRDNYEKTNTKTKVQTFEYSEGVGWLPSDYIISGDFGIYSEEDYTTSAIDWGTIYYKVSPYPSLESAYQNYTEFWRSFTGLDLKKESEDFTNGYLIYPTTPCYSGTGISDYRAYSEDIYVILRFTYTSSDGSSYTQSIYCVDSQGSFTISSLEILFPWFVYGKVI